MGYIDKAFYDDEYQGTQMEVETFLKLEKKASNLIDMVIGNQFAGVDFEDKPEFIKTNVKNAVAAQVEYMHSQGGGMSIHGGGSPASVSVGGFSYTEGASSGAKILSDAAYSSLMAAGLLYGRVIVR